MKRTLRGIRHKATACAVTLAMILGSVNTGMIAMAAEETEEISYEAAEVSDNEEKEAAESVSEEKEEVSEKAEESASEEKEEAVSEKAEETASEEKEETAESNKAAENAEEKAEDQKEEAPVLEIADIKISQKEEKAETASVIEIVESAVEEKELKEENLKEEENLQIEKIAAAPRRMAAAPLKMAAPENTEENTEKNAEEVVTVKPDETELPAAPEAPEAPSAPRSWEEISPMVPAKPVKPVREDVSISGMEAPTAPVMPEQPDIEGLDVDTANQLIDAYNAAVEQYNLDVEAYNEAAEKYNAEAEKFNSGETAYEARQQAYLDEVNDYNTRAESYNEAHRSYMEGLNGYKEEAEKYNTSLETYREELKNYNDAVDSYDKKVDSYNNYAAAHNEEEAAKEAAAAAEVAVYQEQLAEYERRRTQRAAIKEEHAAKAAEQEEAVGEMGRITKADVFDENGNPLEHPAIGSFDEYGNLVIEWAELQKQSDPRTIMVQKADEQSEYEIYVTNFHVYMDYADVYDAIFNGAYFNDYMDKGQVLDTNRGKLTIPASLLQDLKVLEYECVKVNKNDMVTLTNQSYMFGTTRSEKAADGSVNWKSTEGTLMTGRYFEDRVTGDYWINDQMYLGRAGSYDGEGNRISAADNGIAGVSATYSYKDYSDATLEWEQYWDELDGNPLLCDYYIFNQYTYNWMQWDSNPKPAEVTGYTPSYLEMAEKAVTIEDSSVPLAMPEAEGEELAKVEAEKEPITLKGILSRLARITGLDRLIKKEEPKEDPVAEEPVPQEEVVPQEEDKPEEIIPQEETRQEEAAPQEENQQNEETPQEAAPVIHRNQSRERDERTDDVYIYNSEPLSENAEITVSQGVLGAQRASFISTAAEENSPIVLGASRGIVSNNDSAVLGAARTGDENHPVQGGLLMAISLLMMGALGLTLRKKEEN